MNDELQELYQQMIIDHGRHPRNFGECQTANHIHRGDNPLCGDKLTLYIEEENDTINKASFQGEGCAISMASASLMIEALQGKTLTEAKALFNQFHQFIMGKADTISLDKLTVLGGVRAFPSRVKCATLAWHILLAICEHQTRIVTTE